MTWKTDLAPITDMIRYSERAIRHVSGLSRDELQADETRSDALLHALSILGEASTRVSEPTRLRFPEIPWKQIKGTRNVLVHRYDWVNWDIIWSAVTADIPAMLPTLVAIRDTLLAEEPPPPEEV
jgi:uncharacterized protein with HEPN domain